MNDSCAKEPIQSTKHFLYKVVLPPVSPSKLAEEESRVSTTLHSSLVHFQYLRFKF